MASKARLMLFMKSNVSSASLALLTIVNYAAALFISPVTDAKI